MPFSCSQMYELINDIAAYPEYMPGCAGAEILQRGDDWLTARLDLSGAGLKKSFVTRNTLDAPKSILMALETGPFKSLAGNWQFEKLDECACKVSFYLEFEFSNKLLGMTVGKLFEKVASEQLDAICLRAKSIYG